MRVHWQSIDKASTIAEYQDRAAEKLLIHLKRNF